MIQAVRKTVRIGPGGRIEIQDAALPEGKDVEIIVLLPDPIGDGAAGEPPSASGRTDSPLENIFGSGRGGFASVDEVDRYIRDLRDEWD